MPYTGLEVEGSGFYTRSKKEALKYAQAEADEIGSEVEVDRDELETPTLGLVLNMLNCRGWCKGSVRIAIVKPKKEREL